MNGYRAMRLLLMFDLPMENNTEIRRYTHFRKYLLSEGYFMIQYSIYCKILPNRDSAKAYIRRVKQHLPPDGSVFVLEVTEKQYQDMVLLKGSKLVVEQKLTTDKVITF